MRAPVQTLPAALIILCGIVLPLRAQPEPEPIELQHATAPTPAPGPFAPPSLPVLAPQVIRGLHAVGFHLLRAGMLFLGVVFLLPQAFGYKAPGIAFVPFLVPVCYLLAVCPAFFRRAVTA